MSTRPSPSETDEWTRLGTKAFAIAFWGYLLVALAIGIAVGLRAMGAALVGIPTLAMMAWLTAGLVPGWAIHFGTTAFWLAWAGHVGLAAYVGRRITTSRRPFLNAAFEAYAVLGLANVGLTVVTFFLRQR